MTSHASHSAGSTSTNLIQRAQAADAEAWSRLAILYGPLVYSWARRSGLQSQDAADVMQEVFHALTRRLASYVPRSDGGSFRGWLWTISRNKIRDHFRRLQDRPQAEGGTDAYQRMQSSAADRELEASESIADVNGLRRRAMELISSEFESRTWQAFWRTSIESESPQDVANELGISVWAVYKARARVLQRLRDEFRLILE